MDYKEHDEREDILKAAQQAKARKEGHIPESTILLLLLWSHIPITIG